jgi:hypothetical protein
MHIHFQPKAHVAYGPIQITNAMQLVLDILDDPEGHMEHAKRCVCLRDSLLLFQTQLGLRFSSSVILSLGYGRPSPGFKNDPDVKEAATGLARFSQCLRPDSYLVNKYPWLQYIPVYGRTLRQYHRIELALFRKLIHEVEEDIVSVMPVVDVFNIQRFFCRPTTPHPNLCPNTCSKIAKVSG